MGGAAHVLVVDDDEDIRELLRQVLAEEGYRVSVAARADAGEVARLRPDLLLLDHLIHGEPVGWAVAGALRADPATAGLPVILCTAAAPEVRGAGDRLRDLDLGVVLKPFDLGELLAGVRDRLGNRFLASCA